MAHERGAVSVSLEDESTTVVHLDGEIDLSLADALDYAVADALLRGTPMVLDVARVTFIDSTGLKMIAMLAAGAIGAGGKLRIEGASSWFCELLELAGLAAIVDVGEQGDPPGT